MRLLDLVFPPRCAGCGRGGHWLCPACVATISTAPARQAPPEPLAALWAVGVYEDPLRAAISAFKYEGKRQLAGPLGRLLLATYRRQTRTSAHAGADALVPVPLHPKRQAERGYNQSALLARVVGHSSRLPVVEDALRRIRDTPHQAGLNAAQRRANVVEAFACEPGHPALVGRKILLVDDVCSTGTTLSESAKALLAAGAKEVWGLVLARPVPGV